MNFPDKQRTGRVAEIAVEQVFTTWSWTVGHDHIDIGYDMFVEPETNRFKGHRFLVQVKATSQSRRKTPVTRIKRSRLRDYARSPYPVFLIWMAASQKLHWMHIQPWIERNSGRLNGDGEAGVSLPLDQTLDDKEKFVAYLETVMRPQDEDREALPKLAESRSRKLSAIDSRLQVRVGLKDGHESYELFATGEPVQLGFEAKLKPEKENSEGLIKALRYGLPTTFEVDSFSLKGSSVFAAIGAGGDSRGKMTLLPLTSLQGSVNLYSGREYSMLAATCCLPAKLYRGQGGFAVSNEGLPGLLDFHLLCDVSESGKAKFNLTVGMREKCIDGVQIQGVDALGPLGEWAAESKREGAVYIDLAFGLGRIGITQHGENLEPLYPVFDWLFLLARLHKVAKAMRSTFSISPNFAFSEEDIFDLLFAYRLMKGERVTGKIKQIELDGDLPEGMSENHKFYMETAIEISIANQMLGLIPVAIDLHGYTLERDPDISKFRLIPGEESAAEFYYKSTGPLDAKLKRNRAEAT